MASKAEDMLAILREVLLEPRLDNYDRFEQAGLSVHFCAQAAEVVLGWTASPLCRRSGSPSAGQPLESRQRGLGLKRLKHGNDVQPPPPTPHTRHSHTRTHAQHHTTPHGAARRPPPQMLLQTKAGLETSIQGDGTPFAETRVDAQRK